LITVHGPVFLLERQYRMIEDFATRVIHRM
jgi:hypothetical protein